MQKGSLRDISFVKFIHIIYREGYIMEHALKELIKTCELAMKQEDFDTIMNYYTDDAIMVVKPGRIVKGKDEIKKVFIEISKYFNHTLVPTHKELIILESGDTALVMSKTLLNADKKETEYSMDRRTTYVFKKNAQGKWLCAIDNSYGTDLIN